MMIGCGRGALCEACGVGGGETGPPRSQWLDWVN